MQLAISPELVKAARDPDGSGMERLLQVLWPHAFRIARSIVHDHALAEDAAQEACAVIYRQLSQLRSESAFRVWAYRIVAREALRAAKGNTTAGVEPEATDDADVDERMDVLRALSKLSPDLRAAIVLHYYAELNSGEIGRALGIPSPTVRFRLSRARRQLKCILSSEHALGTLAEVSQ